MTDSHTEDEGHACRQLLAALPTAPSALMSMTTLTLIFEKATHEVFPAFIASLDFIRDAKGALAVGAGTRHAEVAASSIVAKAIPALAALAGHIGDPAVRNRGTIGGSCCWNYVASCTPAVVLALGARPNGQTSSSGP